MNSDSYPQPWFDIFSIFQMKTESEIARKARYYARKTLKYTTQPESGYTSDETYCETGKSRLNHSAKNFTPFLYASSPKRAGDCLLAKTYSSHSSFSKLTSLIPLPLKIVDAKIDVHFPVPFPLGIS
jgi:hypothetical protein